MNSISVIGKAANLIPVEVQVKGSISSDDLRLLHSAISEWIYTDHRELILDAPLKGWESSSVIDEICKRNNGFQIMEINVGELENGNGNQAPSMIVDLSGNFSLKVYPYECHTGSPGIEFQEDEGEDDDDNKKDHGNNLSSETIQNEKKGVIQYSHWDLPHESFSGLWENLFLSHGIRQQLLNYLRTAILFSKKGVAPTVVSLNRMILLHGAPGTGKTTLCKALAQKASIRFLPNLFKYAKFIEINSHSLFSKWFSESGKLVANLFQEISDLVSDPQTLVFVLIDEVESLTAARSCALNGNEPSDSIRVVNALLTNIDKLKQNPNVLVMATSNMTEAIDPAFLDRADLSLAIKSPDADAIFKILSSAISELCLVGLMRNSSNPFDPNTLMDSNAALSLLKIPGAMDPSDPQVRLYSICQKAADRQVSGRFLRKLPFVIFTRYFSFIITDEEALNKKSIAISISDFIDALDLEMDKV